MTKESPGLISDLDVRRIVSLVEALDRSSLYSLQLDFGHFRLTLGKGAIVAESLSPARPIVQSAASQAAPTSAVQPAVASSPAKPAAQAPAGTVEVNAPIMGLFYSKPEPSSKPFVSVGAEVDEGTTVGLIEVMKVFNAISAGVRGTIVEICVKDAETVEIGQTLFRIRPSR